MKHNMSAHPAIAGGPAPHDDYAASSDVHKITDARMAHSDDMHARMVKYATAMGIRMVCLVLIFIVPGWFKLIAVAGAVLLPWVAVVIANGGSDTVNMESAALLDHAPPAELQNEQPVRDDADHSSFVVQGEVLDASDDTTPAAGDGA